MLDSLDPYGGNVSLVVNVRNNDEYPRLINKIAIPKHLELITPQLPYTIPPFRSIALVVEVDPMGFEGMQVRKGFTLLFDGNDQQRVTFDAVVGRAMGNFLLTPANFNLDVMDAASDPVQMILRIENKDTENREIIGISSIFDLWLESPSLPHVMRPGEYVDMIVHFDPADYVGRHVSGAFLVRFNKREERKVGFHGEVKARESGVSIFPEQIDLGTIEERGGFVSMRTTVWNNRPREVSIEGISGVSNLKVVFPQFPITVEPYKSQVIIFEFDPYNYNQPRFSRSFNIIYNNAVRSRLSFKGIIVDNSTQISTQENQKSVAEIINGDGDWSVYSKYVEDLTSNIPANENPEPELDNLSIMIHKDESWKDIDFRYIVNKMLEKNAKISMAGAGAKEDALILIHTDLPNLDFGGQWIHDEILKSVGRVPPEVHIQYMSKQAMGEFDIIIFLPILEEVTFFK